MGEAHARLGPSNTRWPNCPGSVREEAAYPDIPGEAAIDGTGSHLLLEYCLRHGVPALSYDGQIIGANHQDNPNGWLIGPDRIARVQECLDYVERRVGELKVLHPDAEVLVEAETIGDPGGMFGRDDWWGTCDITITALVGATCKFVEVIDYKDGRGYVGVKGNTQLLSYLGGKLRPFIASGPELVRPFHPSRVAGCRMTVVQPKTNPSVRYEDLVPYDVVQEMERLSWAAHATDDPNAPLVPDGKGGKGYCRWCKHKSNCNAISDAGIATVNAMTKDIIPHEAGQDFFEVIQSNNLDLTALDNEKLAKLADAEAGVQALFDRIKAEIEQRIETGGSVPGYDMVPGRGSNIWSEDEEKIVKMLKARRLKKEEIYPPKLISPAQVLKLDSLTDDQKKKIEKDFITYKVGNAKLTRVGRKDTESANLMFANVAQGSTNTVDSPELMFADVAQTTEAPSDDEPSFF